jgi:predicted RNA-binding protein YlxR (DUF448 family)
MVQAKDQERTAAQPEAPQGGAGRVRTCVGCGERVEIPRGSGASSQLIRLVFGPEGEIAVDAAGGGFGRGAHVHPRPGCLEKAVQRGLARAARAKVSFLRAEREDVADADAGSAAPEGELIPLSAATLAAAIARALDRRIQGFIVAAARGRRIAPGADAVAAADSHGEARAIVVASDASAGAEIPAVRRAIAEGRAVAWGTKRALGALCSAAGSSKRVEGLGVVAITDDRIAGALREAVQTAAVVAMFAASSGAKGMQTGGLPGSASKPPRHVHPVGAESVPRHHDGARADSASVQALDVARSDQGRRADG